MENILIIGAGGQIGVELTEALRKKHGADRVIASDLRENELLKNEGRFCILDATDAQSVNELIQKENVTQVYLLAAILSATGEQRPRWTWDVNMNSLLDLLEICRNNQVAQIYWPSSIAVFGKTTPKTETQQQTIIEPNTVYGISKYAGELWCQYYHAKYGLDVRSLRYPGIISWKSPPGGGTTDYAIDIYHAALSEKAHYECFLKEDTYLPMMYMDDAIRATIELMDAPADQIRNRMSYNLAAMSFSPKEIAASIQTQIPDFNISYKPDFRQSIAEGWPQSIDDRAAREDWNWRPAFDLERTTTEMLTHLK